MTQLTTSVSLHISLGQSQASQNIVRLSEPVLYAISNIYSMVLFEEKVRLPRGTERLARGGGVGGRGGGAMFPILFWPPFENESTLKDCLRENPFQKGLVVLERLCFLTVPSWLIFCMCRKGNRKSQMLSFFKMAKYLPSVLSLLKMSHAIRTRSLRHVGRSRDKNKRVP